MHTPPPPPSTPPGIHQAAPEHSSSKGAEIYGNQASFKYKAGERPYIPYATQKITGKFTMSETHKNAAHTNRLHSRKQAKQRASRKANR